MKKFTLILFLLLLSLVNYDIYGCTVFTDTNSNLTLVGANEDYKKSNSQVFFIPSEENKYGYVLFGYDGSVQAGLNEKGLFWDGLRAYPYIKMTNFNNKPNINGNIIYKILEECATVNEVIKLFETFYWDGFRLSQLMVVDKSGESAIITYNKNGLVVTKKINSYQVCTNFRISCKEDMENYHWYNIGSGRYNKAVKQLQNQELTVDNYFSILKETCQNNVFAKTIYSTVFNLNSGDIHLSINGNFLQITKINLFEELKKGRHSYFLSELINSTIDNRKMIEVHDEKYLTINFDTLLLDEDWQLVTKKRKATYYRIIKKDTVSGHFLMKDYFLNDTLQGTAYYSSLNPEVIDGKYFEYHENGKIKAEGCFRHRLKVGDWNYWTKDGKLERIIRYKNGIKQ